MIGICGIFAGIYYCFSKKDNPASREDDQEDGDDPDYSTDFADLSNLKFSRHYVDLR